MPLGHNPQSLKSLLQQRDWCGLCCPTLTQLDRQDQSMDLGKKLLCKLHENHIMGL